MLVARQPSLAVRYGTRQPLDCEIAGAPHEDERAAVCDELPQVGDAGLADAAAVLGTDRGGLVAVDDLARTLVSEDNRVELLAQSAGADLRVVDRAGPELVLLEHPPGPAFVHVAAGPRLIRGDARCVKRGGPWVGRGSGVQRHRRQAEFGRDRLHPALRYAADVYHGSRGATFVRSPGFRSRRS